MSNPVLYSFRRCPYAMRARLAIRVANIRCVLREIRLRDKPDEMIAASPKGTVPVLVLPDGAVLEESLDIMLWALRQRDPQGWLGRDSSDQESQMALIGEMDGPFKKALDGYKYAPRPSRRNDPDPQAVARGNDCRAQGLTHLNGLEIRLTQTANLAGTHFGLADAAIAPFVRQFAHVDKLWFDALPLPNLQHWLQAFVESAAFGQIMEKFDPWESGSPGIVFPAVLR